MIEYVICAADKSNLLITRLLDNLIVSDRMFFYGLSDQALIRSDLDNLIK